jgi:hypothetical protein
MRIFLSLLVPFFLNFAGVEADHLYSVSWQDTTNACNAVGEAWDSLEAITASVEAFTGVINWIQEGGTNRNRERELEQDKAQGHRGLCSMRRCSNSGCLKMPTCYEMYNCDECRRRQLIQTERVLTARELQALEVDLVDACEAALFDEGQSAGNVKYTEACKTAMSAATCNAFVTDPSIATKWVSNTVCQNFAVHAATTVTFDGVQSTIYGGDVGVSFGTPVTGEPLLRGGERWEVGDDSTAFATSVEDAHSEAMATSPDTTTAATEIGDQTFYPGTHKFDTAINIALSTTVTLDGNGDSNTQFLFIAGSTLVTGADTSVILTNGAKAENVLWALGSAATLGARSVVEGSILAKTDITFGTQSELRGCALAQSSVTFESGASIITT